MSNIHWYPGHIAKAQRELQEKLNLIDVIIEVIDARLPYSSKYAEVEKLTKGKPRLIIFNKSDLAEKQELEKWEKYYKEKYSLPVISTNSNTNNINDIINQAILLASEMLEKRKSKGLLPRAVRTVVIGMPNVGKSTIINRLTKSSKAKTGQKAGVTRNQQWVRINDKLELLDTPGIIPPIQSDAEINLKLATIGSIGENSYDDEFVASELLKILAKIDEKKLREYYNLQEDEISLETVAYARNWIKKGAEADIERTAKFVLVNFRQCKIGKFILDELPV